MKQLMFSTVLPGTNAVFSAQTQNTAAFGQTKTLLSGNGSRQPVPKRQAT